VNNLVELRQSIRSARAEILKPANERADAIKLELLRKHFGEDFEKIQDGFILAGVTLTAKSDMYNNFNLLTITGKPPIDKLQKFAEAVLYFYESAGSEDSSVLYPMRNVTGFLIELVRFFKEIDKPYAEEMLRVGDLFCENYSGFRKWAFGSHPGSGHYGSTANAPGHWINWFPVMKEMSDSREYALNRARNGVG